MFPAKAALVGAAFSFLATGCAGPDSFGGSRQAATEWGSARGFVTRELDIGGRFRLLALTRMAGDTGTLTVYVEGDGAAWATPWHPPRDPTPLKPVALALAAVDPARAVAYLGRPCQYLDQEELSRCHPAYWTERRFSAEVIDAYDQALDHVKKQAGAGSLRLVGYSGGGVIVTLLAARRDDVSQFLTVCAPLDVQGWVAHHDLSPLGGSLDPIDQLAGNWAAKGVHFVGGRDGTVPPAIVEAFVRARGGRQERVEGFDHECCWSREWPALLRRVGIGENET